MELPSAPVLSAVAEPLYRAAVVGGRASLEVLAERAGVDRVVAADEVQVLVAIGLLEVGDGGIEAVAPRIPLEQVAAEHARAADATRQIASVFADIWSEAGDRSSFVEVITDEARCGAVEIKLMDDTASTVDGLCIGPVSPRKVQAGMDIPRPGVAVGFFAAMERGVRARGLYGVSVLEDFEGLAAVHQCIAVGEQARVFAQVPLNLMLYDGKRALLSVPGQKGARRSLIIVHESGLLDSLAGLFEVFWQMGVPLSAESQVVDALDGPGSGEQQLLSYLAAGLTDEAIARDLGVSARTVGRRIARLEEVLGAHSRFQLAIQASRRGWI
ncbi:helix-turn-helix transcriptional regulator [Kribbella sp. CA-293567]|uniref:helix-turn-helix transcriptional regulator n=1 Tax=Kribbella sp. CA-293567 TaxID=3002436 RepID=UPI0022DE35D9|nr:helix-turn-helix transcriptional regulator [Kribbella sp. CA-293567]WBQ03071.1 helix-turn-helix transcriptional regulator [Kribbella sp. CA-293567]